MTKKKSEMTPDERERVRLQAQACRERNRSKINERQQAARLAARAEREALSPKPTPDQIAASEQERAERLAVYKREWAARNAERVKQRRKLQYERSRAASIAKAIEWNRANSERRKAIAQRYEAANPQVRKANKANRRALEAASGGKATKVDVQFLEKQQRLRCAVCRACLKAGYELDHIVPLASGGRTERTNLQLLCMPCNRSKGAKNPTDFMQQRGLLL
jgi:5-methylcytosine-specific restriction endonuclease McrA